MEGSEKDLEYVIQNSFQQYQQDADYPRQQARLHEIETKLAEMHNLKPESLRELQQLQAHVDDCEAKFRYLLLPKPESDATGVMRPGRMVALRDGTVDWGWGVVCFYHK